MLIQCTKFNNDAPHFRQLHGTTYLILVEMLPVYLSHKPNEGAKFGMVWSVFRLSFTESVTTESENQLRHMSCFKLSSRCKPDLVAHYFSAALPRFFAPFVGLKTKLKQPLRLNMCNFMKIASLRVAIVADCCPSR